MSKVFKDYFKKATVKKLINEDTIYRDIQNNKLRIFLTILPNGENGIGFQINDHKVFKTNSNFAINIAQSIKTLISK